MNQGAINMQFLSESLLRLANAVALCALYLQYAWASLVEKLL